MRIYYNNLMVISLIIFNILAINNFTAMHSNLADDRMRVKISGHATSTLSLCVDNNAPSINLIALSEGDILNSTYRVNVNLTNEQGITNVTINFSYFNASTYSQIGQDQYDLDYDFNVTWATTSVDDSNCNYRIRIYGQSNETACENFDKEESGFFTVDNAYIEPTWNKFNNSLTTNFSQLSRFSNLTGVTVGNSDGYINFSGSGHNFDNVNLDNEVFIGHKSVNFTLSSHCFSSISVNLTLFDANLENPSILRNGQACPGSICTSYGLGASTAKFNVNQFGNYSLSSNLSSNLSIWDEADLKGGNNAFKANENVKFFANYSSGNSPINATGIYCEIKFNVSTVFGSPLNTTYNSTSGLYEYTAQFSIKGNFTWNVLCNGTGLGYLVKNKTDEIVIENTPPELYENISSLAWNEDTTLTGLNLFDYFRDTDNDNLTFFNSPVLSITLVIDSDGIVSFIPDLNFFGLRRMVFYANDSVNTTPSNNLTLTINDVPESTTSPPSSSGSSGGGGGGGATATGCSEEWYCLPWGYCYDTNRTRDCYELNDCGTEYAKPPEFEICKFVASCYDNVLNNDEEGVDCGGQCQPCYTCFDRQLNQKETDIDCGGSCKACLDGKKCVVNPDCENGYCNPNGICSIATCKDGWKNQDEKGIDCGGICAKCAEVQKPTAISKILGNEKTSGILIPVIILLAMLLIANIYGKTLFHNLVLLRYKKSHENQERSGGPVNYITEYSLKKITELERNLTSRNTNETLKKLNLIYRVFIENNLGLPSGSNTAQIKNKLASLEIDNYSKKKILAYDTRLNMYLNVETNKKHVRAFIKYGKGLIRYISKQIRDSGNKK
jgi:hypothetical protein